jgi:hypothetical protein
VLVYGDQPRREDPREKLATIASALVGGNRLHALIEAGELAQGFADVEFGARGQDEDTPLQQAAMALCVAVARREDARSQIGALAALPLPPHLSVKTPEGYAFYGLHPQSYAHAAASHAWSGPPFVIGLRSIGTSLAAVVAAAARATDVITVRPTGDPFRRELRLAPALSGRLAAHGGPFAIVDEGPGLSGSSFGSAADLLEALGVSPGRIVFLPGHDGDLGPEASPAHRARWRRATRLVSPAEPPSFDDIPGPTTRCFVGLGAFGEAKLVRAQALHAAGFTPEPLALREGFLLQRRIDGPAARPTPRRLAAYLRFRRERFPAAPGGSPTELAEMARINTAELLGEVAGQAVQARLAALPLDRARPHAVHVDARLHAANWLGGLKLDALDGSAAHDLVGPQDIAWDAAGAAMELGLSRPVTARLAAEVGADPVMLQLCEVAYPAFQAGRAVMFGGEAAPYRERLAQLAGVTESVD